jgi:hypothetical protein
MSKDADAVDRVWPSILVVSPKTIQGAAHDDELLRNLWEGEGIK